MTQSSPKAILQNRSDQTRELSGHKPYSLTCFGKAALYCNGIEVNVASRKTLALLSYLTTRDQGTESRERLSGLLWGDSSEERARASLRQAISELKQKLPANLIALVHADRLDIELNLNQLACDTNNIFARISDGVVHSSLLQSKRLADSFLLGFEDLDPGFRNWLLIFRQTLHDRLVRSLERLLQAKELPESQRDIGIALLNLDSTHEPACRAAMRASVALGNIPAALRLYNDLWKTLDEEFDSEPSTETQQLVAEIKLHSGLSGLDLKTDRNESLSDSVSHYPLATLESIELLQSTIKNGELAKLILNVAEFDAVGVKQSSKPVVKIFRQEIIASLTRFRDWRVYDQLQTNLSSPKMGFIVEAVVYDEEMTMRFVLNLREIKTGQNLWSERFTLESDHWFQTQQKMIRRIAVALDVNMTTERLSRVSNLPDLSLDLFDRWLRGQQYIFRWQMDDEEKAEKLFRSIVAEAPHFAPAHSGLAGILNSRHLIFPGQFRDQTSQKEALEFSLKAVALDPLDSRTQLHLAWSWALNGDFQKATMNFLLAFELNGEDPWTLVSAAEGLALCGDTRSAVKLEKIIRDVGFGFSELHWSYQTSIAYILGNYNDCVNAAMRCDPLLNCAGAWHAAALAVLGRTSEAKKIAEQLCVRLRQNWHSKQEPTDGEITRWLLHCFPIAQPEVFQSLEGGFRVAGLAIISQSPQLN